MNSNTRIAILGATSPVGEQTLKLLSERGVEVLALSRQSMNHPMDGVKWVHLDSRDFQSISEDIGQVDLWIALSPMWVTQTYFSLMEKCGAKRVLCLSSTSQFTKTSTSNQHEATVVKRLVEGESALQQWTQNKHVSWTVLRPTLIYGRGNDRNLSEIVRIIKKLKFFPLFGKANGLRQPIYVDDVALACVQAILSEHTINTAYNISGAEQLTYREMIARVFRAMGLKPRFLTVNATFFKAALTVLTKLPRYKNWNSDMAYRMNQDMIFSHDSATRDFDFSPKPFVLNPKDVVQDERSI